MRTDSREWTEYSRALRWLRDVGEHLSECRYHSTTSVAVIESAQRLEDAAKKWVAEAQIAMNEAILKRDSK